MTIPKKKKAFTLAELLITLTMVGIMAALTIPAVISKVQEANLRTAWKNVFSTFSSVHTKMRSDYGSIENALTTRCPGGDRVCIRNLLENYLAVIKECDSSDVDNNCFIPPSEMKNNDGTPAGCLFSCFGPTVGMVLADGTYLKFDFESISCNAKYDQLYVCGWINVDVNGFKGPNTIGKDIFMLWITPDSVKPVGTADGFTNNCANQGYSCSMQYLMQ